MSDVPNTPSGPPCRECGDPVEIWGCVLLCDRCLAARLWGELEQDDWLMVRRHPNGDIWIKSNINRDRKGTNATALKVDVRKWFEEQIEAFV